MFELPKWGWAFAGGDRLPGNPAMPYMVIVVTLGFHPSSSTSFRVVSNNTLHTPLTVRHLILWIRKAFGLTETET
jgi:hypothetical protein